jgi:y4mF family transcriptional regulator
MEGNICPYGKINSIEMIGKIIRYRRKELKVTQAKVAGLSGVGQRYLSELERGKPTIEIGKALHVLQKLGLEMTLAPRSTISKSVNT